jgi:hypothetical protein
MPTSAPPWEAILELAITLAREAGAELRRRFGRPTGAQTTLDDS